MAIIFSTFAFKSAEDGKSFFELAYGLREQGPAEEPGLIYSRVNNPDLPGLHLQQGGVWYEWDGQRAMGMIERSLAADHVAIAV